MTGSGVSNRAKPADELNGDGQTSSWLWVQTVQPVSAGLAQSQPSVRVPPLTSGQ